MCLPLAVCLGALQSPLAFLGMPLPGLGRGPSVSEGTVSGAEGMLAMLQPPVLSRPNSFLRLDLYPPVEWAG